MRSDHFGHEPLPAVWDTVRAVGRPAECFADEIAIDFPSIHELVDRVRDEFLGEECEPSLLVTDVSLTRRDARVGVVLPLEVPVRGTCNVCGGRGETWAEPCPGCDGSGSSQVHHRVHLTVPAGVSDGARFRFLLRTAQSPPVRVEVRVYTDRV